jgi:hypothetical protein
MLQSDADRRGLLTIAIERRSSLPLHSIPACRAFSPGPASRAWKLFIASCCDIFSIRRKLVFARLAFLSERLN